MFLHYRSTELDHYFIHPESHLSSDHAPLTIDISIYGEDICTSKLLILPKIDQETAFIEEIILNFKNLNMSSIADTDNLEYIVNQLRAIINWAWTKNAKKSKISKHSKQ